MKIIKNTMAYIMPFLVVSFIFLNFLAFLCGIGSPDYRSRRLTRGDIFIPGFFLGIFINKNVVFPITRFLEKPIFDVKIGEDDPEDSLLGK